MESDRQTAGCHVTSSAQVILVMSVNIFLTFRYFSLFCIQFVYVSGTAAGSERLLFPESTWSLRCLASTPQSPHHRCSTEEERGRRATYTERCKCIPSNIKNTRRFICVNPVPTWLLLMFNRFPGLVHTNMSGSGRARTSSFAEPPGAPGSAAAGAGSAVAGGSSTGKTGASQASGSSSTSFGNLKLPSKVLWYFCNSLNLHPFTETHILPYAFAEGCNNAVNCRLAKLG